MEIRRIWGLSLVLAKANFKLRNEGSYLGILWYLLNPLLMFLLLWAIFSNLVGAGIKDYPLYLLLGIVMFNFFQAVTLESTKAIRSNKGIIKSIDFPHEAILGSVVITTLISHVFEVFMLLILLVIYGVPLWGLLLYPVVLLMFSIFSLGVALTLASVAVYFMDIDNIWSFGSKLLWLATPIFYSVEGTGWLYYVSLVNPIYYFITISRDIVIYGQMPEPLLMLGAMAFALVSMLLGLLLFGRLKNRFAEMI